MTIPLLPQAFPAKVVRVSGTTLFHVAARELGDATQWNRIARLNGLTDPWVYAEQQLAIPQALPGKGRSNG